MFARRFAQLFGAAYLIIGVAGFIPAMLVQPIAPALPLTIPFASGYLLGIFPVNALHDLLHIAVGVWGIAASLNAARARTFARWAALLFAALVVFGLIPVLDTLFGFIPVFGNDVWLHGFAALAAAYAGWVEPSAKPRSRMRTREARKTSTPRSPG